jgi:predicted dehydrogenase
MSVKVSIWGSNGRINVDRQEVQIYLRAQPESVEGFSQGWNVRYTTELTRPVWFYVRGEEYSAQIDHFVRCIETATTPVSNFRSASDTSLVAAMMREDADKPRTEIVPFVAQGNGGAGTIGSDSLRPKSFVRSVLDRVFSPRQTPK